MPDRAATPPRICRRCGREGHAAFRLVDRLPSGEPVWECSVATACGRKRQLVGAPTGRGRSPSTAAARSTLPPTVVLVSDDPTLRAELARSVRGARMAAMRTMSIARAVRSVTWVVARPPDVLVIDGHDLQMAARNGLQRAVRAASGAQCHVIVLSDDPLEQDRWRSDLDAPESVVVHRRGDGMADGRGDGGEGPGGGGEGPGDGREGPGDGGEGPGDAARGNDGDGDGSLEEALRAAVVAALRSPADGSGIVRG